LEKEQQFEKEIMEKKRILEEIEEDHAMRVASAENDYQMLMLQAGE
jgi:hypothetical protein